MAASACSARTRAPGSQMCLYHHYKEIVYHCKNCDKLVCSVCVVQDCQGHVFEGLNNVVLTAKQNLQGLKQRLETEEIPRIEGKLQNVENDMVKSKQHFEEQISDIKNQNETLKTELDKLAETFIKTCKGLEKQNLDELLKYRNALQTQINDLRSRIDTVEDILQSENDVLVFDFNHTVTPAFDDLPAPTCSTLEFISGNRKLYQPVHLLGEISILNEINQSVNRPGKWKVVSTFTPYTEHLVRSIHAVTGDQIWLSFYNRYTKEFVGEMLLTDQAGHRRKVLDTVATVNDFCVSPRSGAIWYCISQNRGVREIKRNKSRRRFTAAAIPQCICVTMDDHVVLGFDRSVVKYTPEGQEIYRTSAGHPPIVRHPYHLSECPLTSNVALVDLNTKEYGGNGKPRVLILNDKLQLLFAYRSERSEHHSSMSFQSLHVCYTNQGELVVTDSVTNSVDLFTGTGRFLRTLYTNKKPTPYSTCVQNDALLVSSSDGSVKVLRNK